MQGLVREGTPARSDRRHASSSRASASLHALLTIWCALTAGVLLSSTLLAQTDVRSGGNGTFFAGTYKGSVFVIDEATFEVTKEIPLSFGVPLFGNLMSEDRKRLYVQSANAEVFDVIDVERQEVIDTFTLQDGRKRVRIFGAVIHPSGSYALLVTKTTTKHLDRFEIGEPTLVRYDLEQHEVIEEIPWPDDKQREFAQMLFSPDGDSLYFLDEEIIVYDAESFEETGRWKYSRALQEGVGSFRFGFPRSFYEEPGYYTGLFRLSDPVQNRRMMGVARVNLAERDVDFYMLGPSEGVSFVLSPDRQKAYGLHHEVGNYQFWTFDLAGKRVQGKVDFKGRPRMSLMPSSNGELLYIYGAGNTFDIYEADTFEYLRTVELDADMIGVALLPPD